MGQLTCLELCSVLLHLAAAQGMLAAAAPSASPLSRCSTCRGPVHSWATLPVSFHSSHSHTGPTGAFAFSELDIETIRKFPLVTIEKWQGAAARESPCVCGARADGRKHMYL